MRSSRQQRGSTSSSIQPRAGVSKKTLGDLEEAQRPLLRLRVRPLTGKLKGDYRGRVGGWRILLTPDRESRWLYVYAVLPQGDAC